MTPMNNTPAAEQVIDFVNTKTRKEGTTMTTMDNIITFDFNCGNPVRIIADSQGDPWFVAKDVCEILGIGKSRNAVAKLDPDEKGACSMGTLGGAQKTLIVNESGLYALILRCRDAMTPGSVPHRFRKWVTSEVLPAIRQTGGYLTKEKLEEALLNPNVIIELANKLKGLQNRIKENAPRVRLSDLRTDGWTAWGAQDTAKLVGIPVKAVGELLETQGLVVMHYKEDGVWAVPSHYIPTARGLASGFVVERTKNTPLHGYKVTRGGLELLRQLAEDAGLLEPGEEVYV